MTAEALAAHPDSILAQVVAENDGRVSGQSAFIAARQGDPVGQRICEEYVSYLSCGIVKHGQRVPAGYAGYRRRCQQ